MKQQPIGPQLPGTCQVLLAFNTESGFHRSVRDRDIATYCESVQRSFLPLGLILWGATNETLVHGVKVGNMSELEVGGYAPIPGRFFEQGRSFEDLERLAEAGELDVSIEARQQLRMNEASPGTMITVALSGPFERFCLWGRTYSSSNDRPHRRASVQPLDSREGYAGRLDTVTLSGVATVLEVTAPDARIAADLLVGLERSRSAQF